MSRNANNNNVIPKFLFYTYMFSSLLSAGISWSSAMLRNAEKLILDMISSASHIFSTLILAYILYLALHYVKEHKMSLWSMVRRANLAETAKVNTRVEEHFTVAMSMVESRVRHSPSRREPMTFFLLIVLPFIIGFMLVEIAGKQLPELEPTALLQRMEEIMLLSALLLLGGFLLLTAEVVSVYVLHILNRDMNEIEEVEDELISMLKPLFDKLSISTPRRDYSIPRRSTLLYIILTMLTLGLFKIYWVYAVIFKDIVNHENEDSKIYKCLSKIMHISTKNSLYNRNVLG
ncbi:MAG: hypothetical protein DRN15_06495 [Thermoprotei archaeon]|nr:MAG: hypothetical protein DRN15_06495 [Thermoprotei archaeon]RLF25485.1 MAG: hypothetical protein DRM97_01610 [Thermoprotei archaeon]